MIQASTKNKLGGASTKTWRSKSAGCGEWGQNCASYNWSLRNN